MSAIKRNFIKETLGQIKKEGLQRILDTPNHEVLMNGSIYWMGKG